MSTSYTETVPCEDCDEHRSYLASRFDVGPCREDPSQPGTCVIEYRPKAAGGSATRGPSATGAPASATPAAPARPTTAPLLPTQAAVAKALVNLFETGEVLGDYGAVTVLAGDTGHLTYGRSQTTLGSGNLALLLELYCDQPGARFATRLRRWLPALRDRDTALDRDEKLHNVLRAGADDPVMRDVQDRYFDEAYWNRALQAAAAEGIALPLGVAIVYDSWVHGSWKAMRDRTRQGGSLHGEGERAWLERYVATRRHWLATHANPLLRRTVYRMDAFQRLMDQGYWGLPLPLVVRGREISAASLSAPPPGCYEGPQPGSRTIAVQSPLQRGLDVRLLQLGLSLRDYPVRADGIFGNTTARLVRDFQAREGHPATGVADPALVSALVSWPEDEA